MSNFTLLLFIGIIAFANSFYLLALHSENRQDLFTGENFQYAMIHLYRLAFGDFDMDNYGGRGRNTFLIFLFWFLCTMLIPLIMMNMLIAIMGDTYDKVSENRDLNKIHE